MVRKKTQPAPAGKSTRKVSDVAPDKEPRLVREPDNDAIWRRADERGLTTAQIDAQLTGRDDGGYQLARKHTAARDGGRYARYPRPGHLIVWAELLGLSVTDTLHLFGYDVLRAVQSVQVVGSVISNGTVRPATEPATIVITDAALIGSVAARVIVPVRQWGVPAGAVIYWHPLEGVARYTDAKLCMVRRAPTDPRRVAWVHSAPGPGAPCVYEFEPDNPQTTTLYACELVRAVVHHNGAP